MHPKFKICTSLRAPRLSRHCLCRNCLRLPNRYRLSSNVSRLVAPWYCEGIEGIKGTRVKPSQAGAEKAHGLLQALFKELARHHHSGLPIDITSQATLESSTSTTGAVFTLKPNRGASQHLSGPLAYKLHAGLPKDSFQGFFKALTKFATFAKITSLLDHDGQTSIMGPLHIVFEIPSYAK